MCERPESITFDMIHDLLWKANEPNRERGFLQATSSMSGAELERYIGPAGKTWVALLDGRLVGTISARPIKRSTWYAKGEILDYILAGVDPDHQGEHIGSALADALFKYAGEEGYSVIELDTAEPNRHAQNVYLHQGFVYVGYASRKGAGHYSVVMAKWLQTCPYPMAYCKLRFIIKRLVVRLRYKPGKKKRLHI